MGGECRWHEPTLRRADTSAREARQGRRGRVDPHRPPAERVTFKKRDPLLIFTQFAQYTPLNAHSLACVVARFRHTSAPFLPLSPTSGTPAHSALRDPL